MTNEHGEMNQETYVQQLQRHIQGYINWASRLGSTVTEEQESEMLEQMQPALNDISDTLQNLEEVPPEDKAKVEEIKDAVEGLDGSVEGTKTCMERISAAFESASEWTQQNLIEPLCNFFKSLYEGACKVCNQAGEKLGFFSKTEGEAPTDDQNPELDDSKTFGSE